MPPGTVLPLTRREPQQEGQVAPRVDGGFWPALHLELLPGTAREYWAWCACHLLPPTGEGDPTVCWAAGSLGLVGGLGGPPEQQRTVGGGAKEAGVGVPVHECVDLQLRVVECVR